MNQLAAGKQGLGPASVPDLLFKPHPGKATRNLPSFSRGTRLRLDMENSCSEHTPMPV